MFNKITLILNKIGINYVSWELVMILNNYVSGILTHLFKCSNVRVI